MIRILTAAAISLLPLPASAERDAMQELARQHVAELEELLGCAREKTSHDSDHPFSSIIPMEHHTPRVIAVSGFEMRSDAFLIWTALFEFADNRILVFDQHRSVDQATLSQPSQIELPPMDMPVPGPVQGALIACGAEWIGNWRYEPAVPPLSVESLLPPLE